MLKLPTGAGKTVVAAAIAEMALAKGNRVNFIVPAVSLIDQTVERFAAEGLTDVGVIQGNHPLRRPDAPIQVCSEQTLSKRGMPDAELIVIDEAHRRSRWLERMMSETKAVVIGLSATPWAKGLGKHYDDLVIGCTIRDLIDAGYLSPFKVYAPTTPDLSSVRTVAGDYHEGELSQAVNTEVLVADVIDTWHKRAAGLPTLVFGVDRTHAKSLATRFEASGVSTAYVDAFTDRLERKGIERAFIRREVQVVVNVGCLTTGVDWPVHCIVDAAPTQSEMLFVQKIGRALRVNPGKDTALILDHAGNHTRLGFVTDIHHEKLDDGEGKASAKPRRKDAPLPKECPECKFMRPAKVFECPACGHVAEPQTDVGEADGELEELTAGKAKADKSEKQRWWSSLLWHERDRGYARGYAAHCYRDRFGVWPRGLEERPEPVAPDVRRWLLSRNIRRAKSRERAAA